jgi:hypothetical protein
MNSTTMILLVGAGITLVLYLMRRRSRLNRDDD